MRAILLLTRMARMNFESAVVMTAPELTAWLKEALALEKKWQKTSA